MKYILMMQFALAEWKTSRIELWPAQDIQAHMDYLGRFTQELSEAGEMVATQGLMGPEEAVIVRATQNGSPAVTDGPFPEAKEFLVGYLVVDVESPQRAHEIAARWSAGPGPGGKPMNLPVEVRPLMQHSGGDA